jgi:hypothetical protein
VAEARRRAEAAGAARADPATHVAPPDPARGGIA